jgi:hypothetical protein
MTQITLQDGKIVLRDGKVGTEQACCCVKRVVCILQESGGVAGIAGSNVVFDNGGGTYETLSFDGVNGYWLGRFEGGLDGFTQSVTISFTTVKPHKATLRCSALDSEIDQESLNYSFSGATAVTFTKIRHNDLTDNGSTVTRPPGAAGSGKFSLVAVGTISEIFFEGEMTDGGSNGIVVEICVEY